MTVLTNYRVDPLRQVIAGNWILGGGNLQGDVTLNVDAQASGSGINGKIVARDSSGNFSANTITANLSGTATNVTGTVAIGNGGTGATTAANARTNLGLVIGTHVQTQNANLQAISGISSNGIYVRTGASTATVRQITANTNVSVTNGNGVGGNITISGTQQPSVLSITKVGTNGSGNIGQSGNRFNIIYGQATTAAYADLAERYTTDKLYKNGTVIVISPDDEEYEATKSFEEGQRVLGVISTQPAFIMNDDINGQAIALRGRVPVRVVGPIKKGQALICDDQGRGKAGDTGNSFALALETNLDPKVKMVECVVL